MNGLSIPPALREQRSHVLFTLTDADGDAYPDWLRASSAVLAEDHGNVRGARHFELCDFDLTGGTHPALPYRYLSILDLQLDGAHEAQRLISAIVASHDAYETQTAVATWLSFPLGEVAGTPAESAPFVTVAFANPTLGAIDEFREWYATRHVRHALNIPELVSGQCHLRTGYQHASSARLDFEIVAVYEQIGTPQAVLDSLLRLPSGTLAFPSLNQVQFAESSFRRMG